MKKLLKTTFLLSFLILFTNCEKKIDNSKKKIDEIEFEKNVLTEVFPKIVDSICVDSRKMDPPPKFGIETWKNGNIIKVDTTKATNKERIKYQNWKKEQKRVDNDTSKIIIGFDQYLLNYGDGRLDSKSKLLHSNYSNFKFDFTKITLNRKFKIKNMTEFPKAEKLLFGDRVLLYEQKYNFVFSGFLEISRIKFDKNKKSGILECSFAYCGRCGRGYRIYIKEINGKWIIEKMEDTWIS
ncbi:hypothetical protein J3S90_15595 [Flavobacterium sp. P4023]|uniref:Lipoprotein n=1 Tax=Flavobacterium flabelliforme TaxID=2816119 RepID=A0ABS5CX63_9FLAO|nr:hypothetical protein [Flavobacterium flabelliforme]MBP4143224.1 hypothetical protein [Flavobacterium flabelliforme]